ncbi:MAG: Cof-type HAD-IIB family hydrolase [Erysipelotrichaceae bacterium]|nr:Cof-type HAD-IIB family hydrolase [Erysipelotrichaceae bacterium]
MIKAVFFDIDGTLYSHEMKAVPESALKAIELLKKKGILVMSCTGRSPIELEQMGLSDIPFDGQVLLSGQLCLDGKGNVIHASPISGTDLEELKKLYEAKEFTISIVQNDGCYVNVVDDEFVRIQNEIHTAIFPVREHIEGDVYQVSLYGHIKEKVEKYFGRFSQIKTLWWRDDAIDLIINGGGKADGIQKMLDHFGIKKEEVIAFGDSNNDLDMMRYVDFSICMGNGRDEVKAISTYVTDPCYEDGIYNALKHFEII